MQNKHKSILVIVLIAILSILSTFYISKLKFNYDFESYFPKQNKDLDDLLEFRKNFENDTDFLIIAIENKNGIYKSDFLNKINSFSNELKKNKHIQRIISPIQLKTAIVSSSGYFEIPLLHFNDAKKLIQDSVRISKKFELTQGLISKNRNAILLVVLNRQNINKKDGDELITNIEQKLLQYNFDDVNVAGKIKASKVYVEKLQDEVIIFIIASAILISIFLFIAYKSYWGVLFPLLTVILSIAWTLAIMNILGKELDLLTSLLPPILFVVAMSDMTHLISKYLEELRYGKEKIIALKDAIKEVGLTTFITAVTTAIGFVTLLNSTIAPIQDFGFYTGIGVFVAYGLSFTLLPAILSLLPAPKIISIRNEEIFWYKYLQKVFLWICRNPYSILSTTISLVMVSIYFIFQISVDAKLLDDISDKDPLKKSVLYLEEHFGGVRPFELCIYNSDSSGLLNFKNLEEINKIEDYLKANYGVNNMFSPINFIKSLNQANNGGLDEYYKFPDKENFEKIIPQLKLITKRKEFSLFANKSFNKIRISGKLKDEGSVSIANKNEALIDFFEKEISPQSKMKILLTGSSLLIDKNNSYLAQSLIEDLILSVISIGLIVGLLFRKLKMIILALIPNLLPLVFIGGIMGIFDIHLKASTSIIFSIAFGIAVDDSIHFLSRFKLEISKQKNYLYALKRTYLSTGKAMVVTSLILISGFSTLLLSTFQSTFYTGLLIGLTLMIAIVADLILLPVLLIFFYKFNNKN